MKVLLLPGPKACNSLLSPMVPGPSPTSLWCPNLDPSQQIHRWYFLWRVTHIDKIHIQWVGCVRYIGIIHYLKSWKWSPMTYQVSLIPSRLSVWTLNSTTGVFVNSSSTFIHLAQRSRYVHPITELIVSNQMQNCSLLHKQCNLFIHLGFFL